MTSGMNLSSNQNSGYDMFSGMKPNTGTSGMNSANSGLMDLGFGGNLSGGSGMNTGGFSQTGFGQSMTMSQ